MTVAHDTAGFRFVATLPGDRPGGVLNYRVAEPGLLVFEYVEVPPPLRGQGVAGRIVEAACDSARAAGVRVIPTCPYIAWWFRQHPEQQDLLYAPER